MSESQLEQSVQMPIKVKPYKHQLAAFKFALEIMGCL